ncbi:uncharacterized protein METZ01_LOCUS158375, partial [marine metagenome]
VIINAEGACSQGAHATVTAFFYVCRPLFFVGRKRQFLSSLKSVDQFHFRLTEFLHREVE